MILSHLTEKKNSVNLISCYLNKVEYIPLFFKFQFRTTFLLLLKKTLFWQVTLSPVLTGEWRGRAESNTHSVPKRTLHSSTGSISEILYLISFWITVKITAHCFTAKASCFVCENSFKDIMNPGWLCFSILNWWSTIDCPYWRNTAFAADTASTVVLLFFFLLCSLTYENENKFVMTYMKPEKEEKFLISPVILESWLQKL